MPSAPDNPMFGLADVPGARLGIALKPFGYVEYEPIHPTQGYNGHWLVLARYLMSRGDIYVFADVGDASKGWSGSPKFPPESGPIGQNRILKWFNPARSRRCWWRLVPYGQHPADLYQ